MEEPLAFRLSKGIRNTISPPIPRAYAWAASYAQTPEKPLLDMAQGVPATPPPPVLLEALGAAAADPRNTTYGPSFGFPALRTAAAAEVHRAYGADADVTADDVAVTGGANMAFVAAVMALADAGDEIILPAPWYFDHQMAMTMLSITPVPLRTLPSDGFIPSVDRCAALITPRTKAIALVTPNNPTGAIYPPALLASFAALARTNNIALILDETYRDFTSTPHRLFEPSAQGPLPGVPSSQPWSWRATLIHLFSFSKSYHIPGHRLGLLIASPLLLSSSTLGTAPIGAILDTVQISAALAPQVALAPLLESLRPFVASGKEALERKHAVYRAALEGGQGGTRGWRIGAQGGYFAFVRHPWRGRAAEEVCRRLAGEVGVVLLPAEFFLPAPTPGVDDEEAAESRRWIRFSVANVNEEKVKQVCTRLHEAVDLFSDWETESL
ncbi:hypothetical protein PLICRDRAFT_699890 [Plicaturopsis crispa FD-325 SS-3]|nr:hypothetical protein PLICRDRAFT_699890 [Plicaturopsis crispa FD-325 SS-3]